MSMMAQTIQKGCCQFLVPKDLNPLRKGEVGSDDGGASFIALRQQIEQQLPSGPVEGHKAQLIYDEQRGTQQTFLQPSQLPGIPSLQEILNQIRRPCENYPETSAGRLYPQTDDQVCFSSADGSGDYDVLGFLDIGTTG
ncbi:hypothetical protein ES705_45957 [subsurface metagenome]